MNDASRLPAAAPISSSRRGFCLHYGRGAGLVAHSDDLGCQAKRSVTAFVAHASRAASLTGWPPIGRVTGRGSSIRDYVHSDGSPGWFQIQAGVYERAGQPCRRCSGTVRQIRQAGRSTYYCPVCQR